MSPLINPLAAVNAAAAATGRKALGGYSSNEKFSKPFIGDIERGNIEYQGVFRNPVILIHGFLGANLVNAETGCNVWGEFSGQDALNMPLQRMLDLALPMKLGTTINKITDSTISHGLLDTIKVKMLGLTYKENAYKHIIDILNSGGYQPEGKPLEKGRTYNTLFTFSYDWRMDLQKTAAEFHKFILKRKEYIQEQYQLLYGIDNYDVRFDIVAHSMGGLITNYYLRYGNSDLHKEKTTPKVTWAGAEHINRIVMLGTPNAGYLDSLLELTQGTDIPPCPAALLGTWPSLYQMMPSPARKAIKLAKNNKVLDIYDINVWKKMNWGLADPQQDEFLATLLPEVGDAAERRAVALDHLEKCLNRAKRFVDAMRVKADHPESVRISVVLGNAVKTAEKAEFDPETNKFEVVEYASGDGKVTKSSVLLDERTEGPWQPNFKSSIRWSGIILLRAAHMAITNDPAFNDNILFLLATKKG